MVKLFSEAEKELGKISDCPGFEAGVIFEETLGKDWKLRAVRGDLEISDREEEEIRKMIFRRLSGEPLQYIVGSWEFFGFPIKVRKGALIPRQDTETLVETALFLIKDTKSPKILDLFSGTGCAAIAIKKSRPEADVTAVEKYPEAFGILKDNILSCPELTAVSGDALDKDLASGFSGYDLITANPPYLSESDMKNLQKEVEAEPKEALYGGKDGLDFYRAVPGIWIKSLKPGGHIAFEIGAGQEKDVTELLLKQGYRDIRQVKDLAGKIRVVYGERGADR